MGDEGRGGSRKVWQCGCRRTAQPHNLFCDACALCARPHWRLMLAGAGDSAPWRERHQRLAVPGTLLSLWYESGCVRLFDCLCVPPVGKTGTQAHALVEIRPHLPYYSCDTAGNGGQHKACFTGCQGVAFGPLAWFQSVPPQLRNAGLEGTIESLQREQGLWILRLRRRHL